MRVVYLRDDITLHDIQMLANLQRSSRRQSSKGNETVLETNCNIGYPVPCDVRSLFEIQQHQDDG